MTLLCYRWYNLYGVRNAIRRDQGVLTLSGRYRRLQSRFFQLQLRTQQHDIGGFEICVTGCLTFKRCSCQRTNFGQNLALRFWYLMLHLRNYWQDFSEIWHWQLTSNFLYIIKFSFLLLSKFLPRTGHESSEEEKRYSSTLSLTSALDEVGDQCHTPAF